MSENGWPVHTDALGLADLIASGELGALEALESAIARADRLDPQITALCNPAVEPARDAARAIDDALVAARRSSDALATLRRERPFLGVPTLLKDLSTAAVGIASTMGSRLFGRIDWPVDSELVRRYRRAGFVLFGRTTSPEMGISPSTEARAYGGPTRNPWNTGHSAGGSSGGAAAAVAARIVPIAHATDGAGSIRIPASCCGLVGLKPTRGLNPAGPLIGEGWGGLAAEHVVSLSVRDSAAALDASAGADIGAPYAAPAYGGSRALVEAIASGASIPALRIALLTTTLDGEAVHAEVAAAVEQAARLLASLGHRIEAAAPQVSTDEILRPLVNVVACGTAMAIDAYLARRGSPLRPEELEPTTLGASRHARAMSGPQYLESLATLHRLNRRIGQFFAGEAPDGGYDAMLLPVLAEPAAPLGRWVMSNPDFLDYRLGPGGIVRYSPFTPLANMTGQPAISVPLAMSADGLPIGVQVIGRFGADALVLQIAAQLERAHPWSGRIAPLATSA